MKHWKTAVLGAAFLLAAVLWLERAVPTAGWGLAFPVPGDAPSAPESPDRLRELGAAYLDPDGGKVLYLTFDAGYENGNVEKILDVMKANDVKGTFFVLPRLVEANTDLCKRMKQEGHLVGNHTVHHKNMGNISDFEAFKKEMIPLEEMFKEQTGYEMDKFFRPPEGAFSENTLKFAGELGYTTVFWSLAYADWDNAKQMSEEKALKLLMSRTHDGCVLLLHPTSRTNARILDRYIKEMKQLGYQFGLVDELKKSTNG